VATLWAHIGETPPKVSGEREGLSPGVDQVVARAMAKDPLDRYLTSTAMTADFRREIAAGTRSRRRVFRTKKQRRTRRVGLGLGIAALLLVATFAYVATRPAAPLIPQPNSISNLDPDESRFVDTRTGIGQPVAVAASESRVWTVDQAQHTVQSFDLADLAGDSVTVGADGEPRGMAAGEGWIFVVTHSTADSRPRSLALQRLSPTTNEASELASFFGPPSASQAVVVGGQFVWLALTFHDGVRRLDPNSGASMNV
jgi:hypothetical protein